MNSPAIRHSKKHRQSQPFVSWLSEAVKDGQWNNDAEKYYGISPYMYCLGDPINKTDLDGKKVKLQQNRYLISNYNYEKIYYCNLYFSEF